MSLKRRRLVRIGLRGMRVAAFLLAAEGLTHAQCAMCKTVAGSLGREAARAMNLGILVLLLPPVTIFCAIFLLALRLSSSQSPSRSIGSRIRSLIRHIAGFVTRG